MSLKPRLILVILFLSQIAISISALSLEDGIYFYDFEIVVDMLDVTKQYEAQGIDGSSLRIETYKGVAVVVKNMSFNEPTRNIDLKINNDGSITSTKYPNLTGFLDREGNISWNAEINYGMMDLGLNTTGIFRKVENHEIAGNEYDGIYHLSADVMDEEYIMKIENGFLTMTPKVINWYNTIAETAGIVINPDGTFYQEVDNINRNIVRYGEGEYADEMIIESFGGDIQEGRVGDFGVIYNRISRVDSSTDQQSETTISSHGGMKIAAVDVSRDGVRNLEIDYPPVDMSSFPDWYINPDPSINYIVAVGTFRHDDKNTALRFAQLNAQSALSYQIENQLRSSLEDYFFDSSIDETTYTLLSEVIDQTTTTSFPLHIENEIYNDSSKSAFIMLSISEEEMNTAIKERLEWYELLNNLALPENSEELIGIE